MRTHGNAQKHQTSNPIQRRLIERFHRRVTEQVRTVRPDRILEVGCGEGYVLEAIRAAGIDAPCTGIDQSAVAIEAARERLGPSVSLHVGDALALSGSLPGPSPDLVLMIEVLEHLDDPGAMLDDLAEITADHVLLSVPREPIFRGLNLARLKNVRDWGNDPEHVQHWSARGFVEFVERRFDVVSVARPLPWTLVLARRRAGG